MLPSFMNWRNAGLQWTHASLEKNRPTAKNNAKSAKHVQPLPSRSLYHWIEVRPKPTEDVAEHEGREHVQAREGHGMGKAHRTSTQQDVACTQSQRADFHDRRHHGPQVTARSKLLSGISWFSQNVWSHIKISRRVTQCVPSIQGVRETPKEPPHVHRQPPDTQHSPPLPPRPASSTHLHAQTNTPHTR